MQHLEGLPIYSATDLNNFLECRRLSELDALVARKLLPRPENDDARAELVREKGNQHEHAFLATLLESGVDVVTIDRCERTLDGFAQAEAATVQAMRSGARVIYQATFFDGTFLGHADFLRRIDTPSALGPWSYEVLDTKLALETKPYFLVQLCNYSEHLSRITGVEPRHGYIILGNSAEQAFLLHEYAAYYRHLKRAFLAYMNGAAQRSAPLEYPHRRSHCTYCRWNPECVSKRIDDDHLSLVAWMRRDQLAKFESAGIMTVAELATASDEQRPYGMNYDSFLKLRRQANLQVQARTAGVPSYELIRHEPGTGFGIMPPPDAGDVFFDMEGDPLYEPGRSLEYLFGIWAPADTPNYWAFWALDRESEKRAFEAFVDYVVERRLRYPHMHVYHYANYEKAALRRLAQQHATREDEVDDLLRCEVFVDLYAVVRQSIAISEDSYSIKRFEKFYGLKRSTETQRGDDSIVMFEHWLASRDQSILDDIERYNADDCRSTQLLRDWLLERREEAQRLHGIEYALRAVKEAPDVPREDAPPSVHHPLLDALLSYHRREAKPDWWAFFDRCDNADELIEFDREAIGGLTFAADVPVGKDARSSVYTYRFPMQRYKLGVGDAVCDPATHRPRSIGTIVDIDDANQTLRLKSSMSLERAECLRAIVPGGPMTTTIQRDALHRNAMLFAEGSLETAHPAVADILASATPRLRGFLPGMPLQPPSVTPAAISSLIQSLDHSYLFIQGPPGSGKTTIAASVIADLLVAGKRVGVTSTGHKAIHNLLHKVEETMHERGSAFRGLYKHSKEKAHSQYVSHLEQPFITSTESNAAFLDEPFHLAGGTAWLFARKELRDVFDYLFIDEAGQVALADALAVSACAKNVILLGDPAQLSQVSQALHPLQAGRSVLEHVLGDAPTVPPERGVFLDRSFRMHPLICEFISDVMYDSRLHAEPTTARHRVDARSLSGSGLRYVPVHHTANASESYEEAEFIVRCIEELHGGTVTDSDGNARPLTFHDVIVVTPYNGQRRLIERLFQERGIGVRVGTVDKFQGQEAAIVFYSMATSSGDDVPRDLDFLFEQNRLNVAVSRARALTVVVCSPRLLDISCKTPAQMSMLNMLCAYVERATELRAEQDLAATVGGLGGN